MSDRILAPPINPIMYQHYRDLPSGMFSDAIPNPAPCPSLIELNHALLDQLGVDSTWFCSSSGLSILSGNAVSDTNRPIAMAYAGHQFGHWVTSLGDGRAHMLGQLVAANDTVLDVQLKGSGRTQFSRNGDGRATIGSVLREYVVSEAMAGLGIPTTRSLAILGTGEDVVRERRFPGAILVRTAASHLRVGTFQYAYANLNGLGVRALADFVISKHFPDLIQHPHQYARLLSAVIERQASLIGQWMLVGFIHGVMNTDNMSIVGETIDYGPCAFIDEFHPEKVFSSIDQFGRYAWDQQPSIAYWNLTQLTRTLLPLLHETPANAEAMAEELLAEFVPAFQTAFQGGLRRKLGLTADTQAMAQFAHDTLAVMATDQIDFTVFFDRLTQVAAGESDTMLIEVFKDPGQGAAWVTRWQALRSEGADTPDEMRRVNPAVIARNHRVEQAIEAAVGQENFTPFRRLCRVLANPFEIDPADRELQTPPRPDERITQTFCGT